MSDPAHHSSQALFRFAVLSQVLARIQSGETPAEAIRAVAAREHLFFDGSTRRLSQRSLYRWLAAYRARGLAGLEPDRRSDSPPADTLPRDLVNFMIREKKLDAFASIPELIRQGREKGILKPGHTVNRSTVYRLARRLGLPLARRQRAQDRDARRFAFPGCRTRS